MCRRPGTPQTMIAAGRASDPTCGEMALAELIDRLAAADAGLDSSLEHLRGSESAFRDPTGYTATTTRRGYTGDVVGLQLAP